MGAHAQAPTPKRQIAAFVNRAPYKERRAKSLERRAEHRYPGSLLSTLCSLLLALCSQCGHHTCLCVTAPVCVQRQAGQTGTRRTSCHEPRNRNRDAAWRVISAFFRSKRRLSVNLGLAPPCVHSGLYLRPEHPRPRESSGPHHDVPSLPLTHKARIPYVPSQ